MKQLFLSILGIFTLMILFSACSGDNAPQFVDYSVAGAEEVKTEAVRTSGDGSGHNTEEYSHIVENEFKSVTNRPLSTFAIDVDAASYSNSRRFLTAGNKPPADAVRVEEFINYFNYDYTQPTNEHPFSVTTEVSECPWNENNRLMHIGLQGKNIDESNLPASNLVFLLDVSGSMSNANKLPLLKEALTLYVDKLKKEDKIAIVVYAGAAGLVMPSTSGANKEEILRAINKLQSGGSTAGGAGINLAYKIALKNFIKDGNNRVILATDGDFNVGISSEGGLVRLIEKRRDQGVFLTVLGFGTGNYKDSRMEQLADNGNGNYAYIDNLNEAKKVLVSEMAGTMFTLAKDVKLQLEFNPKHVKEYRLIGYENRLLADEDFNNDKKDAGDMGIGHSVTALYEIVPTKEGLTTSASVDKLKYQKMETTNAADGAEMVTIKLRYKAPDGDASKLFSLTARDAGLDLDQTTNNFRWSASVASFGMLLRNSKFKGDATYASTKEMAMKSQGKDHNKYRAEMIDLINIAEGLDRDINRSAEKE